jgi:ATP-dependent DNA ligase
MSFPIDPPIEPMLAQAADALPAAGAYLFEPKWDGFRALIFKDGDAITIQSRDLKPLGRYFPELETALPRVLPGPAVLDGEVVIAIDEALDFDALQMRIHPAASRVKMLSEQTPASFVAFDALFAGGRDLRATPFGERRRILESSLGKTDPPLYVTPATDDPALAQDWFDRFEGAGLDGVIAKRTDETYKPGARAMIKIKHLRTVDCVVGGFRWNRGEEGRSVGSLLLGLYDDQGTLHHVGVTSSFTMATRKALVTELEPLRKNALAAHPWRAWAEAEGTGGRMPGGHSRWSAGKDLSWEPLRIERVCEVKYDHLQGDRFRHAATFLRWRPDKSPGQCRYDQLEVTPAYELEKVFGAGRASR